MPSQGTRRKPRKFFCPHCHERLWKVTGSKHYLCYVDGAIIQKMCQVSSRRAQALANQGTYLDPSHWIEEFFCGKHGRLWLLFSDRDDISVCLNAIRTSLL